jgi:hypothetical protein
MKAGWLGENVHVTQGTLIYVCRDNGSTVEYTQEYDPDITAQAVLWLTAIYTGVQDGGPDTLERTFNVPGLDWQCNDCPFRTRCWGKTAEGQKWPQANLIYDSDIPAGDGYTVGEALAMYAQARDDMKDAERRRDFAKALLSGTESATYGEWRLKWRTQQGKTSPDLEAIKALIGSVPTKRGEPYPVISVTPAKQLDATPDAQNGASEPFGQLPPVVDGEPLVERVSEPLGAGHE